MVHGRVTRAVVAAALSVFQAACAAGGGGLLAHGARGCLMGQTMVCDADRPNARRYAGCRCVSQGRIDEFLRR